MSKIRLHGTSSGYTDIAPTAAAGNNTLTVPTGTGTIVIQDSNGAAGVTSMRASTVKVDGQINITTGANAFETSANVLKGASGQKGVYLRSALSSATTPSYSSVDDTNTGIFLPGSDVFAVTTGGSESLRIDVNGNTNIVGVTTSTHFIPTVQPLSLIHI